MEVGSVSSSVSAAASSQVRASRPAEQDQQAQQTLQTLQAQRAQNSSAVDENEATRQSRVEAEKNRPSVNTSGQTVGTRINVTA